ncbi:GTP:AMP phosphotransferase, mitochondrial [Golovinomyces cichoracearum]|uniref:GTP:AMP phosphotransferase, mitochondrial n=1 Tax=Golovinomyces cichoracearum TaxID=62708 RepID=A0A420HG49_9PEZI|nr:GTP:AMP phosphotransferase, mitochondrial [Golovinomyces cichoracearum]
MRLRKTARIIFIGAPGVGKGTQAARLLKRFPQLSSISSGDLLRHNVKNQTTLGKKVASTLASGQMVPDSLILSLIHHEFQMRGWLLPPGNTIPDTFSSTSLFSDDKPSSGSLSTSDSLHLYQKSEDPATSFILDGFPRTVSQAQKLDELTAINFVVLLKTSVAKILERIEGRWVHAPSGRTYNTTFKRPQIDGIDDVTGERLTKRSDDDTEIWKNRLEQFEKTSKPLINYYAQKNLLWEVEGESSDEISPKIHSEVLKRFGGIDEKEVLS